MSGAAVKLRPMPLLKINDADGLAAGASVQYVFNVTGYRGGFLRGTFHQDVTGTPLVEFGESASVFDNTFQVSQDTDPPQTPFRFPFSIMIMQPFVRITFTNGGAPSTFFRADVTALPF